MNRAESRYSLLAAYNDKNGELRYYRLADYDSITKKLVEAEYITDELLDYEPVTLFSREHKDPYKTVFKKWEYDIADIKKQYIKEKDKFKGKAYEIVFLEEEIEFKDFDEKYVREVINNGFYVDYEVNNEFLLLVGVSNNKYVTLLCNKNNFKVKSVKDNDIEYDVHYIDANEQDILHSVTSFPRYDINKNSIITTDNLLNHHFSKGIIDRVRYFYEEVKLNETSNKFLVREVDDYFVGFFSKYFRSHKDIYDLTNKERNKILSILSLVKEDKKSIQQYFTGLGHSEEDGKYELLTVIDQVVDVLTNNDDYEEILTQYLMSNEKFYNKCFESVKTEWENSADFINQMQMIELEFINHKEKLDSKLKFYMQEVDSVKMDIHQLTEECTQKQEIYNHLESEILKLQNEKEYINLQIQNDLNEYKSNVIARTRELAIAEGLTDLNKGKSVSLETNKGYIHRISKPLAESSKFTYSDIVNFDEFVDDLITNISIYFDSNKSSAIAAGMISAIANHKGLVVSEYTGEILANSISRLINGSNTEYYCVTNNDLDANKLFTSIRRSEKTVIYFDGVLNAYNETLLKVLTKTFRNKILIFGIDDSLVSSMSQGLWNFASYISLEDSIKDKLNTPSLLFNCDFFKMLKELKQSVDVKGNKILRKIEMHKLINANQYKSYSYMLSAYIQIAYHEELPTFIVDQLYLSCKDKLQLKEYLIDNYNNSLIKGSLFDNEPEV